MEFFEVIGAWKSLVVLIAQKRGLELTVRLILDCPVVRNRIVHWLTVDRRKFEGLAPVDADSSSIRHLI